MVQISGFQPGLADAVVDLWQRSAPADPITAERFRNLVLLDANFDPEGLRLAFDGDTLVGVAYAVRRQVAMVGADLEPERGWLSFFFVDPEARGRGIGTLVVSDALTWLRKRERTEAYFSSYTPHYILPGLDCARYPSAARLLARLGFTTVYQAAAMDLSLVDYAPPEAVHSKIATLEGAGYSFGTPSSDDLVALVRLAYDHFSPDWARAVRESVAAGLPLDRIVVAREPAGAVVGWGMFGAYEGIVERFGPFGVLDTRRRGGLGEVLLHLSLARMRALGAHGAWFLWTGEDSPAGRLYRKTGFAVTRRFDVMRVSLSG